MRGWERDTHLRDQHWLVVRIEDAQVEAACQTRDHNQALVADSSGDITGASGAIRFHPTLALPCVQMWKYCAVSPATLTATPALTMRCRIDLAWVGGWVGGERGGRVGGYYTLRRVLPGRTPRWPGGAVAARRTAASICSVSRLRKRKWSRSAMRSRSRAVSRLLELRAAGVKVSLARPLATRDPVAER